MAAVPDSVKILIVGGGPAGMTSAISLWKSGFKDIAIIDARQELATKDKFNSRAVTMHPGTIEVYMTSRDVMLLF